LKSSAVLIDETRFPADGAGGAAWRSAGFDSSQNRVHLQLSLAGSSARIV
jgi:hypothetical protein